MDFRAERTKNMYMGIACKTDLIKTNLLGKFRGLRVQLVSFCFIRSRRSRQEVHFNLRGPRGTPNYFEGKEPFEKPRIRRMFLCEAGAVLRKKTWDLA